MSSRWRTCASQVCAFQPVNWVHRSSRSPYSVSSPRPAAPWDISLAEDVETVRDRDQLAEPFGEELTHPQPRVRHLLGEVADGRVRRAEHLPGRRRLRAGEHAQQGRLSGSVGAHQADPVTPAENQVERGEQRVTVVALGEGQGLQHAP